VAIVGTSVNFTENEERDVPQFIAMILSKYQTSDTIIISGDAKGVDSIALEVAKGLGFKTDLYKTEINEWMPSHGKIGYKKRNLQIANDCDELHCISVPVHKTKCYHHDEPQEHEKTAGCWTACKVFEMDKPCQLLVVPNRNEVTI